MNNPDYYIHASESDMDSSQISQPRKGRLWVPILILVILFTTGLVLYFMIPNSANTDSDLDVPWFSVQDGTLYFDISQYSGDTEITVPAYVNSEAVKHIGNECFAGIDFIITVHLPDGIQSIGKGAFSGCSAMRGIKLPESLKSIGDNAFSECNVLEAICIPHSVTEIGSNIFDNCYRLSHVFYTGPKTSWDKLNIKISDTNPQIYCYEGPLPHE